MFKLEKMEKHQVVSFLVNPFKKAIETKDYIIQKYPLTPVVDIAFVIDKETNKYFEIGYCNYIDAEVIVQNGAPLKDIDVTKKPFTLITEISNKMEVTLRKMLDQTILDRMIEIQNSESYLNNYAYYKTNFFEDMVYEELGTEPYDPLSKSSTDFNISIYCSSLKGDEVINFITNDLSNLNSFIETRLSSQVFIVTDIILPRLRQEAKDYVAAGKFTYREKVMIKFLEKTKASGAKQFTVYTMAGKEYKCLNKVSCQGNVHEANNHYSKIKVEHIRTVEHKGKVIYKRF